MKLNSIFFRGRLKTLQNKRLSKLFLALNKSPFYLNYLNKTYTLNEYPIINKKVFMDNFDEISTVNIKLEEACEIAKDAEENRDFSTTIDGITVGLSSGTSGNKSVFLVSENERARWVASILDRVIGFSFKKRNVAFFLRADSKLYQSVKSRMLSFNFFDLFDNINFHIERLNKLQPDILIGQPSLLMQLAAYIENDGLKIYPNKIISIAEVLYPEDRSYLEEVFKQRIHQVYQCSEGFLAATCKEGNLHFNEDFLIIEKKYLDNESKRFHPIITDLFRRTQPIIRFELNDIIHEKEACPCGNKMMAIDYIEGRSDDIIELEANNAKRIKIYPDFFRRSIIMSDERIQNYEVSQVNEHAIQLYIEGDEILFQNAKKAIEKMLLKKGVGKIEIEKTTSRFHKNGNKLRRVRNECSKKN